MTELTADEDLGAAVTAWRGEMAVPRRPWLAQAIRAVLGETADDACREFTERAREHGYCVRCWVLSTHWGTWLDNPKIIRHRRPENCPALKRRSGDD